MWTTLFVAVAVTTVTAGLAPAAVASTTATSAVVTVSPSSIVPGGAAKVTGTLRAGAGAGAGAVAGATVVLQQRLAGASTWHDWRTGRTDASGRFSATSGPLVLSRDFRLHFAGTGRYVGVDSAGKRLTVQQWVKVLTKPSATPIVGSALVFTGTTSAGLIGDLVHLQLAEGTSWTTVATSQVNADGSYSVKGKATVAGTQQYRVQVAGKLGATSATTYPSLFTVSAWYYLADLSTVSGSNNAGTATTGGSSYFHSVRFSLNNGWSDSVTYNLAYKCSRFRSTTGTTDTSSTTLDSHDVVALEGDEVAVADTATGHPHSFDLDVTGGFRLGLSSDFAGTVYGTVVGWGDARILCAGKP